MSEQSGGGPITRDLKDLCQAVEDASGDSDAPGWDEAAAVRAQADLHEALGRFIWDHALVILAAIHEAEKRGRREGLAASGHLCLELSQTVDPKKNLALRKGMHDAGAIILAMEDHEACQRAQARAAEVASWPKSAEVSHG